MKLCSLNVRSIRNSDRFRDCYDMMMSQGIDILCVQESGLNAEACSYYETRFPKILIACAHSADDGQGSGIATMINTTTTTWDSPEEDPVACRYGGRILVTRIRCRGVPMTIANIYAPAQVTPRLSWLIEANQFLSTLPPLSCDAIAGDWNEVTEARDRRGRHVLNPQRSALLDLVNTLGGDNPMADGWRLRNPSTIAYSFRENRNQRWREVSRLDRIYIREDWIQQSQGWKISPSGLPTDHYTVTACIPLTEIERGPGRWRLNPLMLRRGWVRNWCLDYLKDMPTTNPGQEWVKFKAAVKDHLNAEGSKRTFNKLSSNLERRRLNLCKKRHPEIPNEALENRIAALEFQENCLAEWHYRDYSYTALAKHLLLDEKPTKWFYSKARQFGGSNIATLRDEQGELHTAPDDLLAIATRFYGRLYEAKPSEAAARSRITGCINKRIPVGSKKELSALITGKEVAASIRRAKLGTSPGGDGLPYEFYKSLKDPRGETEEPSKEGILVNRLTAVYQHIQTSHELPSQWTEGILSLLYKGKGDNTNLENYRPLSIINVDYKIFTEILMQRLVNAVKDVLGLYQSAFLPGRLIDDNIKIIQYLIARQKAPNRDGVEGCSILFLDQKKAYDRVSHEYMWAMLRHIGVPEAFILWIQLLYRDARTRVFINGYMSKDLISILSGVRQGDPISCPLFIITIEGLACLISQNPRISGVILGTRLLKLVLYADDTALFLKT